MPNSNPRDRFFYPHHTPMKDTYWLMQVLNAALEVNSLLCTEDVQKFIGERLGNDLKDKAKLTSFETELLNSITGMSDRKILSEFVNIN